MTKYIDQFIQEVDTNGEPLVGGKLNFYEAGTTNPTPVYSDEALTTPLSNPVIADGNGRFATMYMQKIKYKIVLTDSDDVVQATGDNLDYTNATLFNDIKVYATTTVSGVVILATTADVIAGTSTTKVVTPAALAASLADLTVSPAGFMSGMLPENGTDADHDMIFNTGVCRNGTNDGDITLATALTKQLDADWVAGDAAGGMPASIIKTGTFSSVTTAVTGVGTAFDTEFEVGDILWDSSNSEGAIILSIGGATAITLKAAFPSGNVTAGENVYKNGLVINATYYGFVLSNSNDTSQDAGYDTQKSGVNLLADVSVVAAELTKYRRVSKLQLDASANILPTKMYLTASNTIRYEYEDYIQQVPTYAGVNTIASDTVPVPRDTVGFKAGFSYFGDTSGTGFQGVSFRNDDTNFIGASEARETSDFGEVSSYNTNDFERIITDRTLRVRFNASPDENLLKTKWYEDERTV